MTLTLTLTMTLTMTMTMIRTHHAPSRVSPRPSCHQSKETLAVNSGSTDHHKGHHRDHHNGHCKDLLPHQGSRDRLPSPSEDENCHCYDNANFRPEGAKLLG